MASWEDTLTSIEGVADPLDIFSFEDSLETSAEKKARKAREEAARLAQDELALKKAVYEENKGAFNDLERELFGRSSPDDLEALAQEYADRRAAEGGVESSNVTTPSGRKGRFDFGSTGAANQEAGPQIPENELRNLYDTSRYYTEDEFKKRIQAIQAQTGAAPLSDVDIRNLYDRGRNQSFDEFKTAAGTKTTATNQAAAKQPITDLDRQRALAQVEANKKNTLPGQLETARGKHQSAVDKLIADLGGIDRIEAGDYNQDWNVDDNRQYVSDETRAAQKQAMDKLWGLTDVKETAEEKLMREVARRNMETDLRAQREAQANDLRTRGMYGSGAELAGFYGAQQELAQRRSLEEMLANANAQKRSMLALDAFGNQSMQLGQQDIQSGMAQDMNSRFNSESQQGWQKHKTKVAQEENEAQARRAATEADAKTGLADKESSDAKWLGNFKAGITSGKAGNNFTGAQLVSDATRNLGENFQKQALGFDADAAEMTHNGFL